MSVYGGGIQSATPGTTPYGTPVKQLKFCVSPFFFVRMYVFLSCKNVNVNVLFEKRY